MPEPIAYLGGRLVSPAELSLPVDDLGLLMGAAATERLRTFGGRLFRLSEHLDRLEHSLQIVGIEPELSRAQIAETAEQLVRRNWPLLDPADDLNLVMFFTPGPEGGPATSCLHTLPIPFGTFAHTFAQGQSLATSEVRQIPASSLPPALKCRSRMHYYLADRQAQQVDPAARALLLDAAGFVSEASSANVAAVLPGEGIVSPPLDKVLPGISIAVLAELAGQLDIPFTYRDLRPEELAAADEVLMCSTSICVLPVVRLDGRPIGDGRPGPTFTRLLSAFNAMAGVDIAAQATRFASGTRMPRP